MILGEKIAQLRRKNGWSQEELADKMGVSRQTVSKWESNQTTPDLERILRLSSLFGVTIDYLLKDGAAPEIPQAEAEEDPQIRLISLADAADYLTLRERASVQIALGTFLCFLAVIPLLLLGAAAEQFQQSEALAALIGLASLFLLAAIAVVIFMRCGFHSAPYHFIELGAFRAEGGVNDMVRARKMQFRSTYLRGNLIGVCLCILSPLALFSGILSENDFTQVLLLCVTLLLAGIGVVSFILVGVRWASMERLLQEGDFAPRTKSGSFKRACKIRVESLDEQLNSAYWLLTTTIYLAWSLFTHDWGKTWIVWPVAGVLFCAIRVIVDAFVDQDGADSEP